MRNFFHIPILALLVVLSASNAGNAEDLRDENILVSMPGDFELGYHAGNENVDMSEYVPKGETVEDWTHMITVQVYFHQGNVDPKQFSENLAGLVTQSCPGAMAVPVRDGTENGYPYAIWLYECPLNPDTAQPETFFSKAVSGNDAFYDVQYAVREEMSDDLIQPSVAFLRSVLVCDTRIPEQACP
ncbi:MAG: hypothetical protein H6874_14185 [Hyphomicrobiaceae bacterium]|nr:hypothetical protein [Hyphomicrobiaceae bacterium]